MLFVVLCVCADPVRPFDFIIDDELMRKSLEQHLLEHNISPVSSTYGSTALLIVGNCCGVKA